MKLNSNSSSWAGGGFSFMKKHKQLVVRILVAILLIGVAFRLSFYSSKEFELEMETPKESSLSSDSNNASVVENSPLGKKFDNFSSSDSIKPIVQSQQEDGDDDDDDDDDQMISTRKVEPNGEEKCDLFTGDWVPNPSGPMYTNQTCPLIEVHQNCMRNGRPDSGYLYWRWSPRGCQLPKFDPRRFLEMMRHKTWALIGDSISRNHVQSLLCMLNTVDQAVEVYHDEDYKCRRWHFSSYNFTISVIWSPFLVEAAIFEDFNGVSSSEVELQLDKLDRKWTDLYSNLDYMIISTGKWFLKSAIYYENKTMLGCHYCPKRNVTELGFDFAYRKTLQMVMDFIVTSHHKGQIFFRTSTPDHFENGEWHNGGNCLRTAPAKEGEMKLKDVNKILLDIELSEFEKAASKASENGVKLKLLDFTNLLLQRPDGHPGFYREFHPFEKGKNATVRDCLHWCLPGPMDSMNDVVMEMVVNG